MGLLDYLYGRRDTGQPLLDGDGSGVDSVGNPLFVDPRDAAEGKRRLLEALAARHVPARDDQTYYNEQVPANPEAVAGLLARFGEGVATSPKVEALKSAVTALPRAARGELPVPQSFANPPSVWLAPGQDPGDAAIGAGLDMTGLAMTGGIAGAPKGAVGSGPFRGEGYHGSPRKDLAQVSALPPERQFDNATSQLGAFFSPTREGAVRYAGKDGQVYKGDLNLAKPYEMPVSEWLRLQAPNKGPNGEPLPGEMWAARAEELKQEAAALRQQLASAGHDGVVVRKPNGDPLEIASFKDTDVTLGSGSTDRKGALASGMALLDGAEPTQPLLRSPIRAYHGSPHDFDRFDLSKIGTGEGAQAYGHGLYFAENEGVARSYRDALAPGKLYSLDNTGFKNYKDFASDLIAKLPGDKNSWAYTDGAQTAVHELLDKPTWRDPKDIATLMQRQGAPPEAVKGFMDAVPLLDQLAAKPKGRMYEVAIHADPERFLDWDKPLKDHPAPAKEAIERMGMGDYLNTGFNGSQLAPGKGGNLAGYVEAGIPGIKYLDAGSRRTHEVVRRDGDWGVMRTDNQSMTPFRFADKAEAEAKAKWFDDRDRTHNYVVFTPEIVEILRKYGIAGLAALPPATLASMGLQAPDKAPQ